MAALDGVTRLVVLGRSAPAASLVSLSWLGSECLRNAPGLIRSPSGLEFNARLADAFRGRGRDPETLRRPRAHGAGAGMGSRSLPAKVKLQVRL
jgi:hypothetical protein